MAMPSPAAHESDDRPLLRIGHSPDPDDAFMWFPLTGIDGGDPLVDTGRFRFETVQQDIETLNQRSEAADLEITAVSVAQVPSIAHRYALTSCGSSMGDGYGPKIVAREPHDIEWLKTSPPLRVAIPGTRTSAFLATGLLLGGIPFEAVPIAFEEVLDRVESGEFDAGIVIHEGQLTYESHGLHLIQDLGAWWTGQTNLPLPLGGNVIRRDLETIYGPGTLAEVTAILLRSLHFALEHRDQAIDYALKFARGMERHLADQFVSMYVNKHTLDFGPTGREAVMRFLSDAMEAGLVDPKGSIDFINPVST